MQFRYIYFDIGLVIHLFFGLLSTSCFAPLVLRSYRGRIEEELIFRDRQTTRNVPIIYGPSLITKNVA